MPSGAPLAFAARFCCRKATSGPVQDIFIAAGSMHQTARRVVVRSLGEDGFKVAVTKDQDQRKSGEPDDCGIPVGRDEARSGINEPRFGGFE
jgi:hypothetical protein